MAKTDNMKQVTLHKSKETKSTVRYDAAEDDDMAALWCLASKAGEVSVKVVFGLASFVWLVD